MSQNSPHGFFYPFVFPFYQKQWPVKTWWVAVLALIPILDLAILRGWRLALVRNMANSTDETVDDILPFADVITFFKHGCILWFMTGFYVIIPTIIIFSAGAGEFGNLIDALGCLWTGVFGTSEEFFLFTCIKEEAGDMLVRFTIEIIWLLVSTTLYRVAMIRYAISGKKRVFLNLPVNAFIALKHIKTFLTMWVFGFVLTAFFILLATLMTMTVVLTPLIPLVLLVVYYYATGYEFGHLAHDIAQHKKQKSEPVSETNAADELL